MSNVDEMLDSAQDEITRLEGELALAERAYAWSLSNPGFQLARMVMAIVTGQTAHNELLNVIGAQACEAMGWAFQEYLSQHPEAPNYLEVTLMGADEKPLYVTVQRPGGKTPHQLRREAEGKLATCEEANREALALRDRLLSELEDLKALGECRS